MESYLVSVVAIIGLALPFVVLIGLGRGLRTPGGTSGEKTPSGEKSTSRSSDALRFFYLIAALTLVVWAYEVYGIFRIWASPTGERVAAYSAYIGSSTLQIFMIVLALFSLTFAVARQFFVALLSLAMAVVTFVLRLVLQAVVSTIMEI